MGNNSRGLRETVVRAMAKVGLVWALAVLGALFMATSAQGNEPDSGYSVSAAGQHPASTASSMESGQAPRTAGLALALVVLAGGLTVLAVGGTREHRSFERYLAREPDLSSDLPLTLGLCFGGSALA